MNRDFKGVWIPKEIWLDDRLTALDKVIFVEIDSLDDGETGCYASNQYLAEFCQCSVTKVSSAVAKLTELGYIKTASFDGRKRILKSRLTKSVRQTNEKFKADEQKVKVSLNNNIANNKVDYIDKEKPKTVGSLIEGYTDNEDLQKALMDFAKMRKTIKNPLTQRAMELLFDKLDKLATDDNTKIEILNQSIMNNWKGVFELKETKKQSKPIPQKRVSNIDHHIANYDSQAYRDRANSIENYQYKKRNS